MSTGAAEIVPVGIYGCEISEDLAIGLGTPNTKDDRKDDGSSESTNMSGQGLRRQVSAPGTP